MSLFDVLNPTKSSDEVISIAPTKQTVESRDDANSSRETQIAARKNQGTTSRSTERVPPVGKETAKAVINGGMTSYKYQINPTDFIPDPDQQSSAQTPDLYREGRMKTTQKKVGNTTVQTQEWSPVPELIAERDRPVLASIRLVSNNKPVSNGANSGTPQSSQLIPEYSKFFLEGVQESENERFQIVETFNDFYVYFYGKKPAIYTFNGHLLNLLNYNWMNEFMYYYENFWRGTKAVELGAKVFLTYNFQQVQGYIVNISTNINALTDKAVPFSFSMIVTKRLIFNGSPDDNVVRDNLLPRTETGLINTTASSFAKALTNEFLNKEKAPCSNERASSKNQELGKGLLSSGTDKIKQYIPGAGSINPLSSGSAGEQRAYSLERALKIGNNLSLGESIS